MADLKKRLATNVEGAFFVDSTCIDCDACRQVAPGTFVEDGDYSAVKKQPLSADEIRSAWHALLTCPVGSIGCTAENKALEMQGDFPLSVDEHIYFCGFNSKDSYGANSYFISHESGNWLVEAPRFVKTLANKLEKMGGLKYIFLSHRDDVADADEYAKVFSAKRIIHEEDLSAQPAAEIVLQGDDLSVYEKDFVVIPTPGHSKGHCVLLYKNKYLFTGDHLFWNRDEKRLDAHDRYCWYSWDKQRESMKSLLDYDFEWVLPGHGQSVQLTVQEMKKQLADLVDRM